MNTTTYSEARKKRDRHYDGKFFFGVKTTGIFCRPSCPSPKAKEENVLYFTSVFDALNQGFRPCRRCKPDVHVEYYNGNIRGTEIVQNAIKMISDGYLHYHSLVELADELEVSGRHLRKLFIENVGASPITIAKYHKAIFARKLLSSSKTTITDISIAAGFGSIRQFNDVFKEIFHMTPTEMRKKEGNEIPINNSTTLLLPYSAPFDFTQTIQFMNTRTIQGVEVITEDSYSRTFRTDHANGYLVVKDNPEKCALELLIFSDDIKCYMEIHNKIRKVFDLDTDFSTMNIQFAKDKILKAGMTNNHVPRMPMAFEPFEFVIRAILGQQISVKAATTLAGRIAQKANMKCDESYPEGLDYYFPTAQEMTALDISDVGITKTRQNTIMNVVKGLLKNDFSLSTNQDFETFRKEFIALKGIGEWTVNYVAMRGLGMVDSFPASDLGIIRAFTSGETTPTVKEIETHAEKWRPYRAYATLCIWNSPASAPRAKNKTSQTKEQ
ncbi:MAG: DNA-3-methyladenine glycosylase 2 family protein [Desulfovibrio sp.]